MQRAGEVGSFKTIANIKYVKYIYLFVESSVCNRAIKSCYKEYFHLFNVDYSYKNPLHDSNHFIHAYNNNVQLRSFFATLEIDLL